MPALQGECNCSNCRKKAGLGATASWRACPRPRASGPCRTCWSRTRTRRGWRSRRRSGRRGPPSSRGAPARTRGLGLAAARQRPAPPRRGAQAGRGRGRGGPAAGGAARGQAGPDAAGGRARDPQAGEGGRDRPGPGTRPPAAPTAARTRSARRPGPAARPPRCRSRRTSTPGTWPRCSSSSRRSAGARRWCCRRRPSPGGARRRRRRSLAPTPLLFLPAAQAPPPMPLRTAGGELQTAAADADADAAADDDKSDGEAADDTGDDKSDDGEAAADADKAGDTTCIPRACNAKSPGSPGCATAGSRPRGAKRSGCPRQRLVAGRAEQRVEPDQPMDAALQPADLPLQQGDVPAIPAVADDDRHRAAAQRPPRPVEVERLQRLADPRPAGPILHQARHVVQHSVHVVMAQRGRDPGQPRAEDKGLDRLLHGPRASA